MEGFEVSYNTLFSFKNIIDDFYLKHCEKDSVLIDVFAIPISSDNLGISSGGARPNGAIKVGYAKLPLHKIIEGDVSFQAQEIIHETTQGQVKVGKIFFQMKMRKTIDQALKWFNQSRALKGLQTTNQKQSYQEPTASKKIIEISVI